MPIWKIMAIMAVVTAVALAIDAELLLFVSILTFCGSAIVCIIAAIREIVEKKGTKQRAGARSLAIRAVAIWLASWVMLFIGTASLPGPASSGPSSLSSEAAPTAATSESPSTDADRLLQADIGAWRQATSTDQMLAAAALAYGVLESRGELEAVGGADGLRPYADGLVYCIDEMSDVEAFEQQEVREIAALCIGMLGDAWGM